MVDQILNLWIIVKKKLKQKGNKYMPYFIDDVKVL